MDLRTVERLVSGEGWGLLQSLPPYDESSAMVLGERLRAAGFDADLVAAALTQSRLRAKAVDKFGTFAAGMMFTADGLEQATRLEVAARHAQRFRDAGVQQVWDLGCGIGSDAMALAGLDLTVTAVDADEVTAAIAGVNLRHWPAARTRVGQAEHTTLPTGEPARRAGAWLDPARRTPGVADLHGRTRRIFRLDQLSPSWETVRDVATRLPAVGAKLSPSFPHGSVPAGSEAQWTSYNGEVLECVVWWGTLVHQPGRSALVLTPDGRADLVRQSQCDPDVPWAESLDRLGEWLYEPDRAVIRAGLTGALTAATGGAELDSGVGYVAAARMVEVPWAKRFRISDALPLNVKGLRALLRDRGVGRLTIKKRGVSVEPEQLRRQLRLHGDVEATIVLTRVQGRQVVLIVHPA
ncbi:MAG TPA: class I SAM-dependent methyltransferase [Segeticoccus sp.]|uniref:class I SAM-dependent methyltransferase n=1 Tax=Segeticoccus sp. TaxID=2706531 RepID=UPI002D810A9E|nr:class I SAM-dependent methyltransferase [Segeticoccus sp.]HET8599430.1 class I SAM-dependent methyltransferase [Segeticoccus sp.]